MNGSAILGAPHLARVPDGRRAPLPMLPPVAYLYLSLMVGIVPTALAMSLGVLVVGRLRHAAGGLGIALLGFLLPVVPMLVYTVTGGTPESANLGLLILVTRIGAVGCGFLLYKLAHPVTRGHVLLGGALVPILPLLGAGMAWIFLVPSTLQLGLELPVWALLAAAGS